jgi:hypothetical protein
MGGAHSTSAPLLATERVLVAVILSYAGVVFCLPVPFSDEIAELYPWWATRIAVGNVQLHELLFLCWIFLYGRPFLARALTDRSLPARQAAVWLIALGLWCGAMSLSTPLPWQDLGRTFRLLLNAVLILAVLRWTRQTGDFPLEMLVLGFLVGTSINLLLSFQYPLIVDGTMRLSGQNTPGVAMGVAIHLCAWLFVRSDREYVRVLATLAALVFGFACAISYSRIGWFAAGLGYLGWAYVLFAARPSEAIASERLQRARRLLVPLLALGLLFGLSTSPGQAGLRWVVSLAEQKFAGQSESHAARWAYVIGTGEILARHPLGVGYSGFYDAMTATGIYRSGMAAEEESAAEANPHATILWYTTAGGIPGGFIAVVLFVMLLNSMRIGLASALGRPGRTFAALAAVPYLVIGLTVPYLYNSIIFVVPVAIAAGWGSRR